MNRAEFEKVVYRVLYDFAAHNETRVTAQEIIERAAAEWVETEVKAVEDEPSR